MPCLKAVLRIGQDLGGCITNESWVKPGSKMGSKVATGAWFEIITPTKMH